MKKKLFIVFLIVLVIIGIVFIYGHRSTRIKNKEVDNVRFYNAKIKRNINNNQFIFKIKTNKEIDLNSIDVDIKNKNGDIISVLNKKIKSLEKNKEKEIVITTNDNLDDAVDASYTVY